MSDKNEIVDKKKEIVQKKETAEKQKTVKKQKIAQKKELVPKDIIKPKVVTPEVKKTKKHMQAKLLIEKTKRIVKSSDNEMQDCKLLLTDDLKHYEDAKKALKDAALDESQRLLSQLGLNENVKTFGETVETVEMFKSKEDSGTIVIKDIGSGKFTGFILALLAGLATFLGLVYLATEKLEMTLDVTKVPTTEIMTKIVSWFSTPILGKEDLYIGIGILAFVVVLVMMIVYGVRVALRGAGNLNFAKKQMNNAQSYVKQKSNCKVEMDKVDAHISDAIKILKDYQVLLREQNGKLHRILHFEGQQSNLSGYHRKSVQEMQDTQNLIANIKRFVITPMSDEGKLSKRSTASLIRAKESLQKAIDRFA